MKQKLYRFCAYRERCHFEVKEKLYSLGVYSQDVDELIVELIQQNFLNEERFAKAYCRGKFYQNNWGRTKIIRGLRQKQISDYCVKVGMKEIAVADYYATLEKLADAYQNKWQKLAAFELKQKTIKYLLQKGYEYVHIAETLDDR